MEQKAILWFRNDLRLHDNEALTEAIQKADKILPVYIFDERVFKGKTSFGFEKTAEFRTKFIIESVSDLQKNLRALGSDLILRIGKPEEEIYKIALEVRSNWVFCNRERTSEEIKVQDKLEKKTLEFRARDQIFQGQNAVSYRRFTISSEPGARCFYQLS
jgi:deoxyribodipyrimidine photo-lyase